MIKLKDVKVKGVCHANVFTHNDIERLGTLGKHSRNLGYSIAEMRE